MRLSFRIVVLSYYLHLLFYLVLTCIHIHTYMYMCSCKYFSFQSVSSFRKIQLFYVLVHQLLVSFTYLSLPLLVLYYCIMGSVSRRKAGSPCCVVCRSPAGFWARPYMTLYLYILMKRSGVRYYLLFPYIYIYVHLFIFYLFYLAELVFNCFQFTIASYNITLYLNKIYSTHSYLYCFWATFYVNHND